jgi:hypothetical protein
MCYVFLVMCLQMHVLLCRVPSDVGRHVCSNVNSASDSSKVMTGTCGILTAVAVVERDRFLAGNLPPPLCFE